MKNLLVICTIFCCPPFGIIAIIYSSLVNSRLQSGNIDGAANAAKISNAWSTLGIFLMLLLAFIYIVIVMLYSGAFYL